jgi:integrase/recombinase XerD
VLRVCGKGIKVVLVPLPPAVGRAIDRAIGTRSRRPILLNSRSARMDRHAATRRLRHVAEVAGVRLTRPHPHLLRHTYLTTMLDAGVDLRDVQIGARHPDPRTTMRYDRQEPRPPPQLHPRRLHGLRHLTSQPHPWPGCRRGHAAVPMSGHFALPHAGKTCCGWPASDVWLTGHQSREET